PETIQFTPGRPGRNCQILADSAAAGRLGGGVRVTVGSGAKKESPGARPGLKRLRVEFSSSLFALRRHVARVDRRSTRNRQFKGPCGRRRSRLACPVNVSTGSGGQLNSSDRRRKNHCRVSDLS